MTTSIPVFTRDRLTWMLYWTLGVYAYLQAVLGPLMPFLRTELNLNYSTAALHLSAFAVGMITAGLTGDRLAEVIGRKRLLWGSVAGMSLGTFLLIIGASPVVTIAGALVMGAIGAYIQVMIQAVLSDHHGSHRAIALTESNAVAVTLAAAAPLTVALVVKVGLGWRAAALMGILIFTAIGVIFRTQSIPNSAPHAQAANAQSSKPLPLRFWLLFIVILFVVSIEWSLAFWGADFLKTIVGLEPALAAGLMTAYLFGMAVGRFSGSRLARSLKQETLLLGAIVLVIVGFPLFWLGEVPIINVVGLFISGLGVANLFPLSLSLSVSVQPEQANKASARVALGAGAAILIAPQVMGAVADQVGIHGAFGMTAVLTGAALLLILLTNRVR